MSARAAPELTLAPGLGGAILSLTGRAADGTPIDWLRPTPPGTVRGLDTACYPLVPFSNRIAGAAFPGPAGPAIALRPNFAPEPHAIHGVGFTSHWTSETPGPGHQRLSLNWPGIAAPLDAGCGWPWRFRAVLDYRCRAEGLEVTLAIENRDRTAFPSGLGLHPFFPRRAGAEIRLNVTGQLLTGVTGIPQRQVSDTPAIEALRAGGPLPVPVDNAFAGHGPADLHWPQDGRRITITATQSLGAGPEQPVPWWVIFAPPGGDFFCVEPVTQQPDAHNGARPGVTDPGLVDLEPGQTHALRMDLALSPP